MNAMFLIDFYKVGHVSQYPQDTTQVWSNWTPRSTRVKGAKQRYEIPESFECEKIRDPESGVLKGFTVPPAKVFEPYDSILIVDDICDGGGTFMGIAEKLPKNKPLYLYVTHGIFSKGLQELQEKFNTIFTTDSLLQKPHPRLTIFPCEQFLVEEAEHMLV